MCIHMQIKRKPKYNEINNNSNKAKQNGKKSFKYNKNEIQFNIPRFRRISVLLCLVLCLIHTWANHGVHIEELLP